jgi:hypothetical protein
MAEGRRGDVDELDPMQAIEEDVDKAMDGGVPLTPEEPADYDYEDPRPARPDGPVHQGPLNYLDSEVQEPPTKSGDAPY